MKNNDVPIKDKYLLTVEEASLYFNIGQSKLRTMISLQSDSPLFIHNNTKVLIKRKLFEQMLDESYSI